MNLTIFGKLNQVEYVYIEHVMSQYLINQTETV